MRANFAFIARISTFTFYINIMRNNDEDTKDQK